MEYYIMVRKWRQAKHIELKIQSAYFKKKKKKKQNEQNTTHIILIRM